MCASSDDSSALGRDSQLALPIDVASADGGVNGASVSPNIQAQANLGAVLVAIGDAVLVTDAQGRVTLLNPVAERLTGWTTAEALGIDAHRVFDIINETTRQIVDSPVERAIHNGVVSGLDGHTLLRRRDGSEIPIDDSVAPVRDTNGTLTGVVLVFRDVSERRATEAAAQAAAEKLSDVQGRMEAALLAGSIATWTIDLINDRVVGDALLAHLFSVDPQAAAQGREPLQTYFNAIHPDDRPYAMRAVAESVANDTPYAVEVRLVLSDGSIRWVASRGKVARDADGKPLTMFGAIIDITFQKRAGNREQTRMKDLFMRAPAFMAALRGPQHTYELANLPYLQLIGRKDDDIIIGRTVAEVVPEMAEQGFIGLLDQVYRTGEAFIGKDIAIAFQADANQPLDVHFVDFTFQPLYDEDESVSGILIHGIDLTERKRLEIEREALLRDAQLRAEREALLNQISAAVRAALGPEEVQARAVELLGNALNLDRCYFALHDQNRAVVRIGRDWHRPDLAPLTGRIQLPHEPGLHEETRRVREENTIFSDVRETAFSPEAKEYIESFGLRALIGIVLRDSDDTVVASLRVSMADAPRVWTPDEIALVESVATLVQNAVQLAQQRQRERTIALQLQDALVPPAPNDVPGLALASYYRPALDEAGVGGDFFDVFPVEDGCTALVVADLSGKGLQAASQVATVRNMLRYALYGGATAADALTDLHRTLVCHELLTGFATLFIGLYDEAQCTLTYVNCGQEPGLIWRRANGQVEQLLPTGPVLGGFGPGDFWEREIALAPGDVLALFTDGLTEVGPTRKTLLEVEGVSDVLRDCCAASSLAGTLPQEVVAGLIAGVDNFAHGGVRDDIALLVGVVGRRPVGRPAAI